MARKKREYAEFIPGLYTGMSTDEYFAIEAVNNSYLGDLKKCPANVGVVRNETVGMSFGKAVHSLFLEGKEAYEKEVVVVTGIATRGAKAYKEVATAEENKDKIILLEHEDIEVHNVVEAVNAHPRTAGFWDDHVSVETVVMWIDPKTGLQCKARIDKVLKNGLLDLKSTADHDTFVRYALKGGYFRQAAFYLWGYNIATGKNLGDFYFAVVSTKPPYQTEYYRVEKEAIEYGMKEADKLMALAAECREWGLYPHYTGDGMVKTLGLPGWVKYQEGEEDDDDDE